MLYLSTLLRRTLCGNVFVLQNPNSFQKPSCQASTMRWHLLCTLLAQQLRLQPGEVRLSMVAPTNYGFNVMVQDP